MSDSDSKVLPLFRPEAVQAQTGNGLGEIILSQPLSARLLSAVSVVIALSATLKTQGKTPVPVPVRR